MKKIIITIDGWSSCGKSTLAKQLAKSLGYIYVDSGAMYRAITLYFLRNHIDWTDREAVKKGLANISLEFSPLRQGEDGVLLDNTNLTEKEQFHKALKWAQDHIKQYA